jgi:hypothetical protein
LSQQQAKRQPFAVLLMNFEKNFFKILINTTKQNDQVKEENIQEFLPLFTYKHTSLSFPSLSRGTVPLKRINMLSIITKGAGYKMHY